MDEELKEAIREAERLLNEKCGGGMTVKYHDFESLLKKFGPVKEAGRHDRRSWCPELEDWEVRPVSFFQHWQDRRAHPTYRWAGECILYARKSLGHDKYAAFMRSSDDFVELVAVFDPARETVVVSVQKGPTYNHAEGAN